MYLSCAIVEDLQVAADHLANCCLRSRKLNLLGQYRDAGSALEALSMTPADILFLDVEMPGGTGFELLDRLPYKPVVILTTSKEEYAYSAFEYRVADFLKKPFSFQRFMAAVDRAYGERKPAQTASPLTHLFVRHQGKLLRLRSEDILYAESMRDYVRLVTPAEKYICHQSMRNLEQLLDPSVFMRVHRSYLVNMLRVEDIRETELRINGISIPVSKNLRPEVLRRITIL